MWVLREAALSWLWYYGVIGLWTCFEGGGSKYHVLLLENRPWGYVGGHTFG
jgi:hypothetical protein